MKKLLTSIIASAALLFGFASCSGDLHDLTEIDLSAGTVAGAMNGWVNTSTWTTVNGNVYTYDFVATDAEAEWKCIAVAGNWNSGAFGGGENAVIETPVGATTALEYDNATGGSKNAKITGLSVGSTYRITVTVDIIDATAKVECISSGALPTPYYFDGVMYLVGDVFALEGKTNAWSFSTENLISGGSVDASTGIVTYTKDITAVAASGQLGINDSSWGNKQNGAGVTVNADGTEVLLDGGEGNFDVTGLTAGKPYRVTITTNPDKEVSVSIAEICNYTLTFKVIGGDEGTEYYFDGNVFGNWHNSWPIKSWSSGNAAAYTNAKTAHPECFATADDTGVAVFTASVDFVGEPGETVSYEIKVVSCTSDGADPDYNPKNIGFDIDVTAETFVVSWDVSADEITVQ